MILLKFIRFVAILLQVVTGQFNDGSNSYGYDISSACSKPYSRNGKAHYEKLPCDFSQQNWCTISGSAYPWHAVKRFVFENQGLVKRMYGDEKHINVLRSELDKNGIELEHSGAYHRHLNDYPRFMYGKNYDVGATATEKLNEYWGRIFMSKSSNDEAFVRPYIQPTATSNTDKNTIVQTFVSPTQPSSFSTFDATTVVSTGSMDAKILKESLSSFSETLSIFPEKSLMVPSVMLSEIARVRNSSLNEIPDILKVFKGDTADNAATVTPSESEIITEGATLETVETAQLSTISMMSRINQASDSHNISDETSTAKQPQFKPRPVYHPSQTKHGGSNVQTLLFQDMATKDEHHQSVFKIRGVNACPIKEEVVAPFWANNTRGEVLALLNLYPFEQYVHWEKCTHENKQMYCREGCKCEQQYRLHRLLAYDPNNECRGIFSDWFKFPSCCVCRCYSLPIEFRITSRSPRTQRQMWKPQRPQN